jgi:hypothetical protein
VSLNAGQAAVLSGATAPTLICTVPAGPCAVTVAVVSGGPFYVGSGNVKAANGGTPSTGAVTTAAVPITFDTRPGSAAVPLYAVAAASGTLSTLVVTPQ